MNVLFILANYKLEFAVIAVLIGAIAAIPYIQTMWRGHRPPYTTYFGWLLIGVTGFIFHYQAIDAEDAKWSAFLPALYIVIPAVYIGLLVYLKAGWELNRRDKICLSGIVLCWMVWVVAHLSGVSAIAVPLLALVATDIFSTWPILEDALRGKESGHKNRISWSLTAISTIAGVFAVAEPWSSEMIYPGYLMIMMSAICYFSLVRRQMVQRPAPWAPRRTQVPRNRQPVPGQ